MFSVKVYIISLQRIVQYSDWGQLVGVPEEETVDRVEIPVVGRLVSVQGLAVSSDEPGVPVHVVGSLKSGNDLLTNISTKY